MKIFLKNRKKKKEIKELLKAVKHAKNMREDIVSTELLNKLEIFNSTIIPKEIASPCLRLPL